MARILFAWELGGGFGHAGPLRALADRLAAAGHEPVFALRNVVVPAPLFRERDYPVLQAPFWPKPFELPGRNHAIAGYSDVLALSGYGRPDDLAAMVSAWDALLDRIRPDLVVVDNAPTLALAVYDRIPAIFTGYGFTLPPAHEARFPKLRHDTPLLMAESHLLRNVEAVQRRRSAKIPAALTELFRGCFRALTCVRELDPYADRQDEEFGPLEAMPKHQPLPEKPALFAYLGGEFGGLQPLVQALSLLRRPVYAFLRDEAAMHGPFLESRGVRAFRTPPSLAAIVPRVSSVLSMAGHTTAHAALIGGRSQIVLPIHVETQATARRLIDMDVARIGDLRGEPSDIAAFLEETMLDQTLRDAADIAATAIAQRPLGHGLDRLAEACRSALA